MPEPDTATRDNAIETAIAELDTGSSQPQRAWRALRATCPVAKAGQTPDERPAFHVTRWSDIDTVLRDGDTFSSSINAETVGQFHGAQYARVAELAPDYAATFPAVRLQANGGLMKERLLFSSRKMVRMAGMSAAPVNSGGVMAPREHQDDRAVSCLHTRSCTALVGAVREQPCRSLPPGTRG